MYHKPHSIFEAARDVLSGQPIKESTKVEKLSDLSDDEKAKIEDILSRRDKNMPDGMKNRKRHPILMFDKHGQYHGSYASVSDAEEKIKRVGDTEGWINGPRLVQVDDVESTNLDEASKAPDVKKYYDDQEDISKQWPISARKQLKFEKQKKGSVELIIVKAPSGQELERYQLVPGTGWTKLGESTNLKEAYQPSRYYRAVEENLERLLVLFNPNGQLAKELEREADNVSSEFNKLKGLIEEAIDIWESEIEYTVAMSNAAEDEMIDDMDPSDFDESAELAVESSCGASKKKRLSESGPSEGDFVTWSKKAPTKQFSVDAIDGHTAWLSDEDGEEYEADINDLEVVEEEIVFEDEE